MTRLASSAILASLAFFTLAPGAGCATSRGLDSSFTDGGAVSTPARTDASASVDAGKSVGVPPLPDQLGDGDVLLTPDASASPVTVFTPQCTKQGQCTHVCGAGVSTTISGTVLDPAGKNPLYGVAVFVPYQTPDPMVAGPVCDCGQIYTGGSVASAITDAQGHFTIQNVPDGNGIPLVVQVGKWRRQFVVNVQPCQDNPMPSGMLRLPNNGSVGDLPNIAIATGGADTLECLLTRIGVDESEYVGGPGSGHIHIFQGDNGPTTSPAAPLAYQSLWDSLTDLMPYDIVLLSCEGHETTSDGARAPLTPTMMQALSDYASTGGRVFASHFHYAWFNSMMGPFGSANLATWTPGTNTITPDPVLANIETTLPNGSVFPKGVAMQGWLSNVGALTNGELPIGAPRHNADVNASNVSTPWIKADNNASKPGATMYLSFDMPLGASQGGTAGEAACGRIVYSDLHVGADSNDYGSGGNPAGARTAPITPTGCNVNAPLSAQEKALEFMLFDLSACLTPVSQPPAPPPVQPPAQ